MNKFREILEESVKDLVSEGLRGENFYYEWDLMNKSEELAKKALKGNGFVDVGSGNYRNSTTKELADIRQTSKGWKINISDSHGKPLA